MHNFFHHLFRRNNTDIAKNEEKRKKPLLDESIYISFLGGIKKLHI